MKKVKIGLIIGIICISSLLILFELESRIQSHKGPYLETIEVLSFNPPNMFTTNSNIFPILKFPRVRHIFWPQWVESTIYNLHCEDLTENPLWNVSYTYYTHKKILIFNNPSLHANFYIGEIQQGNWKIHWIEHINYVP